MANKVLHTPGGDIEIKSEEQKAFELAREMMIQDWTLDPEPYQTAAIDWTQIQSDEDAQLTLDSIADMAVSMVMARVMHHGIRTKTPPHKVHVTVQVVTETEDGNLLPIGPINPEEDTDGQD